MPSGTFTAALQWSASCTSKLSTPGRSFAIRSGSMSTSQTISTGASKPFVPSTFIGAELYGRDFTFAFGARR